MVLCLGRRYFRFGTGRGGNGRGRTWGGGGRQGDGAFGLQHGRLDGRCGRRRCDADLAPGAAADAPRHVEGRRTGMKASGGVALAIVLALAGCAGSDRAPAAVSSVAVNEERVTIPADPFPSTYRPAPSEVTVIRGATMFDGEGGRIDGGAIRLANGRIEAIGGIGSAACRASACQYVEVCVVAVRVKKNTIQRLKVK